MLRGLVDEVLACAQRTTLLVGSEDPELMAIWRSFERVSSFQVGTCPSGYCHLLDKYREPSHSM